MASRVTYKLRSKTRRGEAKCVLAKNLPEFPFYRFQKVEMFTESSRRGGDVGQVKTKVPQKCWSQVVFEMILSPIFCLDHREEQETRKRSKRSGNSVITESVKKSLIASDDENHEYCNIPIPKSWSKSLEWTLSVHCRLLFLFAIYEEFCITES